MLHFLLNDFSSDIAAARSAPGLNDTSQLGQEAESTKQRRRQSGQCVRLKVSPLTCRPRGGSQGNRAYMSKLASFSLFS